MEMSAAVSSCVSELRASGAQRENAYGHAEAGHVDADEEAVILKDSEGGK